MSRLSSKQYALCGVLSAMTAVLGSVALDFTSIKISFETFPIIIAALLFGPLGGIVTGGIGSFIYQMLRYGVSVTTPLWILPYIVCGAFAGAFSRRGGFDLSRGQILAVSAGSELLVTAFNTLAIYVDSHIYGYYYPAIITGMLIPRVAVSVAKAVVLAIVLPELLKTLKKTVR
jgi:ECF transporter S component (folate family)